MTLRERLQILSQFASGGQLSCLKEEWIAQAIRDAQRAYVDCNGSCDIELARRQVGPDGAVPGNARECAELWEAEARRLRQIVIDLGGKP